MNLFKRLLLNLFPRVFGGTQGPAGVFLSLVNAKHFFTVMSKRMVENPKLNFFDIGLDPLETKIGFGPEATIKPKDIEAYYSYCAAANLNGYKSYSVMNISTMLVIAYSQFLTKYFQKSKKGVDHLMVVLLTIHIIPYFYVTKIKHFEGLGSTEVQFNHFVNFFCELLKRVAQRQSKKISKKQIQDVKNMIISEHRLFFGLLYVCKDVGSLIDESSTSSDVELWIHQNVEQDKRQQYEMIDNNSAVVSDEERQYILGVIPVEFVTKLLYNRNDVFRISDYIIPGIYDSEKLLLLVDKVIEQGSTGKKTIEFYSYLMDHTLRKKNFFSSVKKMIEYKFSIHDLTKDSAIEEFLSTISDGSGAVTIPEAMRKEGILMDRLLNFYVGLMGIFFIGKSDTGYHRLFHESLLLMKKEYVLNDGSSMYIENIVAKQNKCDYFHHVIFQGVSSGKASFVVPYVARESTNVVDAGFLIKQFTHNALCIVTQDILQKDIKLTINNDTFIKVFQSLYAHKIATLTTLNNLSFMEAYYKNIDNFIGGGIIGKTLGLTATELECKNNKECCYTLEYRLYNQFIQEICLFHGFANMSNTERLIFLGQLRDTICGCYYFYATLDDKIKKGTITVDNIKFLYIYFHFVLGLSSDNAKYCISTFLEIYEKHHYLCSYIGNMDDNKYFLEVGIDCRLLFDHKQYEENSITKEDELRLFGYLKHITYYNKKFILPKM